MNLGGQVVVPPIVFFLSCFDPLCRSIEHGMVNTALSVVLGDPERSLIDQRLGHVVLGGMLRNYVRNPDSSHSWSNERNFWCAAPS